MAPGRAFRRGFMPRQNWKGAPGPYAPMNRTARSRSCSSGIPSSQLPPFRSRSDHLSPSPTANGPSNSPSAKLPYQPQDGLGPVDRAPPQHRRASSPQSCSRPAGGLVSAPMTNATEPSPKNARLETHGPNQTPPSNKTAPKYNAEAQRPYQLLPVTAQTKAPGPTKA